MPPPKPKRKRPMLRISRRNARRLLDILNEIDALTSNLRITNGQLRHGLKLLRTELAQITQRWKP